MLLVYLSDNSAIGRFAEVTHVLVHNGRVPRTAAAALGPRALYSKWNINAALYFPRTYLK